MVSKGAKLALQIVGYLFTLGEAIAPSIFTFPRIVSQQDVGPNTCFPFELLWYNGVVQLGSAARTGDKAGMGVSSVVVIFTSVYCLLYLWYSTGEPRRLACGMFGLKVVLGGLLLTVEFTYFAHGNNPVPRDYLHSLLVFVITCLTYFSPAKEVWDAFKTHDVGGLDILLSMAFLGNAIIGTVSGCMPVNGFEIVTICWSDRDRLLYRAVFGLG